MRYKFTFKKNKPSSGLLAIGEGTPSTIVKYNGQIVGELLTDDSWIGANTGRWRLRLKINNIVGENCVWRWASLKSTDFASELEGRAFIKAHAEELYNAMADVFKD